jgi:hypothetical protein
MKVINLLIVVVTNSFILSVALLMLSVCVESKTANYKIAEALISEGTLQHSASLGVIDRYALNELNE